MHLRELSRLPLGIVVSALLAAFAAAWSVASISLSPPGLTPRAMEMASASTQVVVDTPYSAVLDLRQATNDIIGLKNRAVLIGTLMASAEVRAAIAQRVGIPAGRLEVVAPRTPEQPRPIEQSGAKPGPGDLLKSTDQYRLDIQANPTVPILNIDAQAPTDKAASSLPTGPSRASATTCARSRPPRTPKAMRVELRQLGAAKGQVINKGVQVQVMLVVFMLVFAFSCAATILVARVRRGWRLAGAAAH